MKGFSFNALVKAFTNQYQVGDLFLSLGNENPGDRLGGTWELLDGGASLVIGNGGTQTGISLGNNTVTVPVPKHKHETVAHSHGVDIETTTIGSHSHTISGGDIEAAGNHKHDSGTMNITGQFSAGVASSKGLFNGITGAFSGDGLTLTGAAALDGYTSQWYRTVKLNASKAAGTWTGLTSEQPDHTHSRTPIVAASGGSHKHQVTGDTNVSANTSTTETGTANATIDVIGKHLLVNVWRKTAM